MGNSQTSQIFALGQGWRKCDTSILMHLTDIGRPARIAYNFWALVPEGGTEGEIPILVDVGSLEAHYQRRYPDLEEYRRPGDLLAPFDIRYYEVESVILTHLHWDHFSACRLYSSANYFSPGGRTRFLEKLGGPSRLTPIERWTFPFRSRKSIVAAPFFSRSARCGISRKNKDGEPPFITLR